MYNNDDIEMGSSIESGHAGEVIDMQSVIDFRKLGERIRKAREELHLTQGALGDRCGCTNNHISHMETGQTTPSLSMMLRLSYALNKDLNYFILDTPYVHSDVMINTEIAEKLEQCSPVTLMAVSKVIDALLQQQREYENRYE